MTILASPVPGYIHGLSWPRPLGNHEAKLTQDFGPSSLAKEPPYTWNGVYYPHFHLGIDIGNKATGIDVFASFSGRVTTAGKQSDGAILVVITQGDGDETRYRHLSNELVSVGQLIARGKLIGHTGATGVVTAAHLHFGMRQGGKYVDPWPLLAQNVTIRPTGPGINIRATAGSGTTPGMVYAHTDDDGSIRRADGVVLGATSLMRRWDWPVVGAKVPGNEGGSWERIWLDDGWRYIAPAFAFRSQPL